MGVSTLPRVFGGVGVSDDLTTRPASGVSESDTSATLVLNFISEMIQMAYRSRNLSDIVTFTRASTKTYFGSDGKLKTAAINEWPLEYDPVTLAPIGRSVWEARTNLLTYSEQFDNAAWVRSNATVTANAATAPDGTLTADKFIETATSAQHYQSQTKTVAAGTAYTYSIFAKAGERTVLQLGSFSGQVTGDPYANFNLSTGVVTTSGSIVGTITPTGDGFYRCSVTVTPIGTSLGIGTVLQQSAAAGRFASYTGDGTSGIYIWGAQLEAGAFATPYIPTTTAAVTRASESALMTGANFSDWYNQSEGAFVVEGSHIGQPQTAGSVALSVSDNTLANYMYAHYRGAGQSGINRSGAIVTGGVTQATLMQAGVTTDGVHRTSFSYQLNNAAGTVDGNAVVPDASCTIPTVDRAIIGGLPTSQTYNFNGHIRSVTYYPKRLSNAQLQALSS